MLCGEKPAVISTVLLLLAAANPVTWESTVRRMENYRLLVRRRFELLVAGSTSDYGALWLVRALSRAAHGKSKDAVRCHGAVSQLSSSLYQMCWERVAKYQGHLPDKESGCGV